MRGSKARALVERFAQAHALSTREVQVVLLTAQGQSMKQIAGELSLSVKTVETYWSRICGKTGFRSQLAVMATLLQAAMDAPDRADEDVLAVELPRRRRLR